MYRVIFTQRALKDWRNLDKETQDRIAVKLKEFAKEPYRAYLVSCLRHSVQIPLWGTSDTLGTLGAMAQCRMQNRLRRLREYKTLYEMTVKG